MGFLCFLDLIIRSFLKRQSFIDGGIGFVIENAEQLSEKIKALGNQNELKQKIEAFMQSQAGATDKIVGHSFITNTLIEIHIELWKKNQTLIFGI